MLFLLNTKSPRALDNAKLPATMCAKSSHLINVKEKVQYATIVDQNRTAC